MADLETQLKESQDRLQEVNEQYLQLQELFRQELQARDNNELQLLRRLVNYMSAELEK